MLEFSCPGTKVFIFGRLEKRSFYHFKIAILDAKIEQKGYGLLKVKINLSYSLGYEFLLWPIQWEIFMVRTLNGNFQLLNLSGLPGSPLFIHITKHLKKVNPSQT